jgi:hypothetical protein
VPDVLGSRVDGRVRVRGHASGHRNRLQNSGVYAVRKLRRGECADGSKVGVGVRGRIEAAAGAMVSGRMDGGGRIHGDPTAFRILAFTLSGSEPRT